MNLTSQAYWERAGEIGYAEAMFGSGEVERYINHRLWNIAIGIGKQLGLAPDSRVLDLGCGDGAFANLELSRHFGRIDGIDLSTAAIQRARANASGSVHFQAGDITAIDWRDLPRYDGVFLIGILHHVKAATPGIVRRLREVTDRLIVLEPNGDNLLRKLLELTPSYREAGERSFRTEELRRILQEAGYRIPIWKRLNLFPNFTPAVVLRILRPLEPLVENTRVLRALCTVNMYGCCAPE